MLLAFRASGLGFRFGLAPRAWVFYWACLFFGPSEWACAPLLCVRCAWARAITFLVSGVISTCQLKAGSVRALSSSFVL